MYIYNSSSSSKQQRAGIRVAHESQHTHTQHKRHPQTQHNEAKRNKKSNEKK